ncbi:acyl-CoA thioesterase [Pseudonocardia sp.]|uniref:acyl-CoA thioesterase n=1 Tax=Pseudonocardia sp. TaxID=60912 RepID=UPI003D0F6EFC
MTAAATRPAVTIRRTVEWSDTDASGHHYNGVVLRWVEAAEAELLGRLGLAGLFGRIPRVRYETDFRARLWFGDEVEIDLTIGHVGTTSMRYDFEVRSGTTVAAAGSTTVVNATPDAPAAIPWPDDVRAALAGS